MKCKLCGKIVEPTRKNVIKNIKYKKGDIEIDKGGYGCINVSTKTGEEKIIHGRIHTTYKANKDHVEVYFICPVCDTKTFLQTADFSVVPQHDKGWDEIKQEAIDDNGNIYKPLGSVYSLPDM